MGEFRRQPSKVWWSSYEDEDLSKFSGFLNWGKGVDLSDNFDSFNNNLTSVKSGLEALEENSKPGNETTNDQETGQKEEDSIKEEKSRESHRGSSSSPSQGSHKSQDSGFSDSEIQNNALSLSPRSSPELSERLSCIQCKAREESKAEENEKTYNETVASYRKLKTSVKTAPSTPVEYSLTTQSVKFLETAFDSNEVIPENSTKDEKTNDDIVSCPKQKNRKNLIKSHFSRTKLDTLEKINQIQNQLEFSFKLPKKINLPQNFKIPSLFQGKSQQTPQNRSSSDSLSRSDAGEEIGERMGCHQPSLDNEGFKVPKAPGEHNLANKGNNHFLDLTDIGGPPISTSTPKSNKFQGRESPVPKTARATEKKVDCKTTFATIRKLKELPEKNLEGSINLLNSISRNTSRGSVYEKAKVSFDPESSVKKWLSELKIMYEAEIMTTLQSKSLATDLTRQVTNMADSTSQTVRRLHQKTKIISLEFSKLCHQNKKEKQIKPVVQNLVEHVTEFIREYVQKKDLVPKIAHSTHQRNDKKSQRSQTKENSASEAENCHEMITDFRQAEPETVEVKKESPKKSEEEEVLKACDCLLGLIAQDRIDRERVETEVLNLGQKFTKVVDTLLESHIQALVKVIEEPRTELTLRTALSALISIGLEGNQLGLLVSKFGGIRALLAVCLEARATAVRVSALRALATVCCVADTIRQFEQAGGVEIIADLLADKKRCEAELSEAAAVIAQITAPWVQDNHAVEGLSQFLNSLVTSLTHIVSKYNSCETLLLASAALANLTFMEPRTVWPLLENKTAKKLLTAVRRQGPKVSVFIQEQAATVIANMASIPECRKHLTEQKAVVALLCFLEIHHSPLQRAPEVAAAERVQQKSAIALSRLCSDTEVAKQVIELQGVNRLVRLCKEEKERNHSDGVLVACLAALRKIVANCGTKALEELNAMELVEPRLLDSFLLYSSKQESYV